MRKIEKIFQLLESQNIKPATFERDNDLGNGYLKKVLDSGSDITDKMLRRIEKNSKKFYAHVMDTPSAEPVIEVSSKEAPKESNDDLKKLIEANWMLAQSVLIDARNRENLTESNRELTKRITANAPQQNDQELTAIRAAVVEFVIEVASGKRFRNRQEAGQAYSKKVAELMGLASETDIQKHLDKFYISK